MAKFQIVTPHDDAQCIQALEETLAHDADLMSRLVYGCKDGDHTGYAVIDASDEAEARSRLPRSVSKWARVVEVKHITPEEIKARHDRTV